MGNATFEKLNAENNPLDFGGVIVTPTNQEGAEVWKFGDKFATRWHNENDSVPTVWNGGYTDFDLQIPYK
jgi:hypothetical protein